MEITIVGLLVTILGIWSLNKSPIFLLTTSLLLSMFGASAAINLTFIGGELGGASILASPFYTGFIALKMLLSDKSAKRILRYLLPGTPGFWLLATVIFGLFQTFLISPFFYGIVYVPPVNHGDIDDGGYLTPLGLSSGNFTQSIYALGEFVLYLSISFFVRYVERFRILNALILVCLFYVLSAAIDELTFYTGTSFLIDWFRNAKYQLMLDVSFEGFRRISGFFSEASIFSIYSGGVIGILVCFVIQGYRRRLTIPLLFFTSIIMVFSTSSTSYATIITGLFFLTMLSIKEISHKPLFFAIIVIIILFLIGLLLTLAFIFPDLVSVAQSIFDTMLYSKLDTVSGVERSAKNLEALQSFVDTFGLGVGFGGARTSSFVVTIISNLGVIGTLFFTLFLYDIFISKSDEKVDEMSLLLRKASRFGMIGILLGSSFSLTVFDLGPFFYLLAAISSSTQGIRKKKLGRKRSPI